MRLSLFIGLRYLFSRSRINAINWVSGISAVAIGVVTMALVCVLSVYNGYVGLILEGTEQMDPDLVIAPRLGQTMTLTRGGELDKALAREDIVAHSAKILTSKGLLRLRGHEWIADIVGIDASYPSIVDLGSDFPSDAFTQYGSRSEESIPLVLGAYLAYSGAYNSPADSLQLIFPKRQGLINPLSPASSFIMGQTHTQGSLMPMREDIDNSAYIPLEALQRLLGYEQGEVSRVAVTVAQGVSIDKAREQLQAALGESYQVLDRAAQHPELSYLIRMERVITYVVLLFVLVLAACNMASSLAMLIIEKRGDISTLYALGATEAQVGCIFRATGLMISLAGTLTGLVLGLLLCWGQQKWEFLSSGTGLGRMAFPVEVKPSDILIILASSVVVSMLVSIFPTRLTKRRP